MLTGVLMLACGCGCHVAHSFNSFSIVIVQLDLVDGQTLLVILSGMYRYFSIYAISVTMGKMTNLMNITFPNFDEGHATFPFMKSLT